MFPKLWYAIEIDLNEIKCGKILNIAHDVYLQCKFILD